MATFLLNTLKFLLIYILPTLIVYVILPPDSETIKYQFIAEECSNITGNVVIGDSRTEIGFLDSTSEYMNLSLGGSTPLEGYETIKRLNLSKIDTIIISYSYFHLFTQDCFYKRALPSGYISDTTVETLKDLINSFSNSAYRESTSITLESNFLERYNFCKRNGLLSPSRLITSLKFLLGLKIESINYAGGYGRTLYRSSDLCNQDMITHDLRIYNCPRDTAYFDPINKYYLEKIIESFSSEAQIYFIEWSRLDAAEDLTSTERNNYLSEIQKISPNIKVIGSLVDLGCEYFYDADHLNAKGAQLYTDLVKQSIRKRPTNISIGSDVLP